MKIKRAEIDTPLLAALCGGAGAGFVAAYFLDPVSGRRRRHIVRDKLLHWSLAGRRMARKTALDLSHRAEGLAAETRTRFRREDVSDEVLIERVRSELGRAVSHPKAIEVSAQDGVIRLWGDVLADEAEDLIRHVTKVRGVRSVEDQLVRHSSPGNVPALQGNRTRVRQGLRQETWPPSWRAGVGLAGAAAATYGIATRGMAGGVLLGGGLALLARAVADMPLTRVIGVGAGRRAIDLTKHIRIRRPVEDVFSFFSNFENFPRFMSHLKSVRVSNGRSHWVLDGPAHLPLSWDAETVSLEPNRSIAWRSVPGSVIRSAGIVRFDDDGDGGTMLEVRMTYNPPAGAIGHAIAKLFGTDPKKVMDDDLLRLKSLLENGRATAHHQQVTIDEFVPKTRLLQ